MLCCDAICDGVGVLQYTCYIKYYYILMLTFLSVIVILSKCCTPPFPISPAMFLFSTMTCVICTTSVLQGPHAPLFIHPLLDPIWQCFFSFSREVPEQSCCVFSERKGIKFARGISHQEIWGASALSLPCDPVPGTFACFFLLSRVLRLVVERERHLAGIL